MTILQGNGCSLTFFFQFKVAAGGGGSFSLSQVKKGKKPVANYQKNRLKVEVLKVNFVGQLFRRALLPV